MPPKKETCRNFQRGSCQYGERCKFLHVTQQQPKANVFGFGAQTSSQFQRSNSQHQKPNPFGFGVQGSSQPRGATDFGSKQNQFKPFENKWTRFSPINTVGSQASRQPDNLPATANHKCTDPESCKRQIIEDFEQERPLWKLSCYGHGKSSPCDIIGDISYEELRAAAYDDAKRGLSLQSIVERERGLLNAKLLEFENLLRNPYAVPQNSAVPTQSAFPGATSIAISMTAQNSSSLVSSFSELGAPLNMGFGVMPATPNNGFGSIQTSSQTQTTSTFGTNNSPFGVAGSLGSQSRNQSFGSSFASNIASFNNSVTNSERNPFSSSVVSVQTPSSPILSNGPNSASTAIKQLSVNAPPVFNTMEEHGKVGDNIWLKDGWNPGEIPEEAPPEKYIF
ncbi:Zinc finger CCCH domain-containing protein [Actinidia chinensis var. chinensis]|uniref:Zinc finger CCCH domain-containing protein n=1 Tax=Actinidia chinensis var. chinensis TaxID=1590841 RepID=A0A2R6S1C4_ACTCC|nr:Zinc finger CCCH domain-containing protein [Actinidia chinensis var. chinensis]